MITIANLAVALARSGRNVALVDLDLRQPVLAKYFELQGRHGITDVVLQRADLDATLAPIRLPVPASASLGSNGSVGAVGRLDVLPAGPLPANPGELVGTQALGNVLDELRDTHDYVLVDAAPLLSVGDSMTLSARVDGVLVVTRLGVVNRPMLTDLSRELTRALPACSASSLRGSTRGPGYGYGYGRSTAPARRRAPPRRPSARDRQLEPSGRPTVGNARPPPAANADAA